MDTNWATRLWPWSMALSAMGLIACGGGSTWTAPPSSPGGPVTSHEPSSEAAEASALPAPADDGAPPARPMAGADQPAPARRSYQAETQAPAHGERVYEPAPPAQPHRPGLGTEWGETRYSRVSTAPFLRADRDQPFATARIFYNDRAGIQAMIDSWGGSPSYRTRFPVHGGHLDVSLRGGEGRLMSGFDAGGRSYVTGEAGQRYTIVVDNRTPGRIEAVVSVDGLDVIDGRPASFGKRGYLLEPHGHLEIEGFRRSEQEVAAFRFGSVRNSYASRKHGNARNVGVIGFAFFHEQGDVPSHWSQPRLHDEANRRHTADPFPARYATPPN